MSSPLPRISPEVFGLTVNASACAQFMLTHGMNAEQVPGVTIDAAPGTPEDARNVPQHIAAARVKGPVYTTHRFHTRNNQFLTLYPDNIRTDPEDFAPTRHLAERLSEAVDYATLGTEGIQRNRQTALRRRYVKAIIMPSLATTALGAAEGTSYYLNESLDLQLPGSLAILGLGILGAAAVGTHTMGREAYVRQALENETYQTWPEQQRARERAEAYVEQVRANLAPPLASLAAS